MISAKMHPIDHISIEKLYLSFPNKSSGERYQSVTTTGVYALFFPSKIYLPKPKSQTYNKPSLLYRILEVFRSLCMIPL